MAHACDPKHLGTKAGGLLPVQGAWTTQKDLVSEIRPTAKTRLSIHGSESLTGGLAELSYLALRRLREPQERAEGSSRGNWKGFLQAAHVVQHMPALLLGEEALRDRNIAASRTHLGV